MELIHTKKLSKNFLEENLAHQQLANQESNVLSKINNLLEDHELEIKREDLKINVNYLVSRSCLTKYESIVYGFKFFNIDLSSSNFPNQNLFLLNNNLTIGSAKTVKLQ